MHESWNMGVFECDKTFWPQSTMLTTNLHIEFKAAMLFLSTRTTQISLIWYSLAQRLWNHVLLNIKHQATWWQAKRTWLNLLPWKFAGIILFMRRANERRRNNVMSSLIGWVHTQNDPWIWCHSTQNIYIAIPYFISWYSISISRLDI